MFAIRVLSFQIAITVVDFQSASKVLHFQIETIIFKCEICNYAAHAFNLLLNAKFQGQLNGSTNMVNFQLPIKINNLRIGVKCSIFKLQSKYAIVQTRTKVLKI